MILRGSWRIRKQVRMRTFRPCPWSILIFPNGWALPVWPPPIPPPSFLLLRTSNPANHVRSTWTLVVTCAGAKSTCIKTHLLNNHHTFWTSTILQLVLYLKQFLNKKYIERKTIFLIGLWTLRIKPMIFDTKWDVFDSQITKAWWVFTHHIKGDVINYPLFISWISYGWKSLFAECSDKSFFILTKHFIFRFANFLTSIQLKIPSNDKN